MNLLMKSRGGRRTIVTATLLLVSAVALSMAAGPYPAPNDQAAVERVGQPDTNIRIYVLKHAECREVASIVDDLLGHSLRIIPDLRTNSVIVVSEAAMEESVSDLIARIDVKATEEPPATDLVTEVFTLENTELTTDMQNTVLSLIGGRTTRIAMDPERNRIAIEGEPRTIQKLRTLLTALDQPVERRAAEGPMRVRVVWLVSGMERDAAAPPDDLDDVVQELAELGVTGLKMAAQNIIRTIPGEEFQINSIATLDAACDLQIYGRLHQVEEGIYGRRHQVEEGSLLNLGVNVRQSRNDGRETLCNLETTIDAPLGHSVVLGVSPVDEMTSVFVVQVLPVRD